MIDKISAQILTILESDPRLFAGGEDYATGWDGVFRVSDQAWQKGYVNLVDHALDRSAIRPAVFLGLPENEGDDDEDFEAHSGDFIQFRTLRIVLVVATRDSRQSVVKAMRSQLSRNIRKILLDHSVEDGYWWLLELVKERRKPLSASDGSSVADALSIMLYEAHYSECASSE